MDETQVAVAVIENEIKAVREAMDLRFTATEKALELQEKEYLRRLADLNHEAQQLKDMQVKYLPRETWDTVLSTIQRDIRILEGFQNNQTGRQVIVSGVISAIVAIVTAMLVMVIK